MMFKSLWIVLCWMLIPILLLWGSVNNGWQDLQIHDTYLVFSKYDVTICMSVILFIYGLGYFVFNKMKDNELLSGLHILFTTLGFLGLAIVFWWDAMPVIEFSFTSLFSASLASILLGALVYAINFASNIIRVKTS